MCDAEFWEPPVTGLNADGFQLQARLVAKPRSSRYSPNSFLGN
jgi:hypothetical protein